MSEVKSSVSAIRIRKFNRDHLNSKGRFVLYWMLCNRRPFYNFALQHAVDHARKLQKPLLILEVLSCNYPYASDRIHNFILQGMADNNAHFRATAAYYYPYVETDEGSCRGLLQKLAEAACLVVTDDHPGFFYPKMLQAAGMRLSVTLEAVDSNGLLPLRAADHDYPTAYAFRRYLQKTLPGHLFDFPLADPLKNVELARLDNISEKIQPHWPAATDKLLLKTHPRLSHLPINHSVAATKEIGGWREAKRYLHRFLKQRLPFYLQRSAPEKQVSSELSPYLHFGQISTHQIVQKLFTQENWSLANLSPETRGKRSGWWGLSEAAESFLDELVTWREIGFNTARFRPNYDQYHSLPGWAQASLAKHRDDPRIHIYSFEQFEQAQTHDPLWNGAQIQLLSEGRIQNYLRMLWGKKIFEWSPDPETALQTMLRLNDKYALDGRDPNSISGIFWCLGRYDRAWGPERPIFGKIRYMTSENTARKFSVKNYLQRYAKA